ncbi:MAG TPA: hypothetical protein VJC06_00885 [Candidatus Paceibacterota bacterium]
MERPPLIILEKRESSLGTYIGHIKETPIERIDKEKEKRPVTLEQIKIMIAQDESERMFVGSNSGLFEMGGGEKESGFIKFEDIQHFIDENEKSPVVAHTHPIAVFDNAGYTPEELNKMRTERNFLAPMPPSITDIMGSVSTVEHFKDQDVEIRNKVYDPTGMWEYTLQQDNSAIELFKKFQHDLSERTEASLTDTDKQIMEEHGINKAHPAKRVSILKANPSTRVIGEKLEQTANQFIDELTEDTKEALSKFGKLEYFCLDIAGAKRAGHDQEQTKKLIRNYIETAASIGIQVSYTPY